MKLTPKTKKYLDKQFKLYSKRLGIKGVMIYYDNKAYNKLGKWGSTVPKDREIYINVKKHKTAGDLLDTVVHELVHIKYPKLKHGSKFQNRVNDIIIGI